MRRPRVACGLIWLLLAGVSPSQAAADGKVGLVNVQHLLSTVRGMVGGRVEGDVQPNLQEIERLERELKQIKEEYGRERARLSREAKERYGRDIIQRTEAIQRLHGEAVREAMLRVHALMSPEALRPGLERMIQRFGRDHGFAMILDKESREVFYRGDESDKGAPGAEIDITVPLLELLPRELSAGRIGRGTDR